MPPRQPLVVDCEALPEILPNQPLLTSFQAGWSSIQLAHYRQPMMDWPEMSSPQHMVVIPLGHNAVEGEVIAEGRIHPLSYRSHDYANGCIQIFPADLPFKIHPIADHDVVEFIHCYMEPNVLAQMAHESVNPDRVELLLEIKRVDLLIHHIGLALRDSLATDGMGSRFYADSHAIGTLGAPAATLRNAQAAAANLRRWVIAAKIKPSPGVYPRALG